MSLGDFWEILEAVERIDAMTGTILI
jgi:hypothetical protein